MKTPDTIELMTQALANEERQDAMPYSVATDALTDPTGRHSSAFKRSCREAREKVITPTATPRDPIDQLKRKIVKLSIERLNRLLIRVVAHQKSIQSALDKIPVATDATADYLRRFRAPLEAKLEWLKIVQQVALHNARQRKAIVQNYPMFRTGLTTYGDEVKKYLTDPINEN